MQTQVLAIFDPLRDADNIARAAAILRAGGLVSIPTETVYGLAANAMDRRAVQKIFEAKGRPGDNPVIVHVSDEAMLRQIVREVPPQAQALIDAFWPGPLTLVLPRRDEVPDIVSAGLPTVAVRMPSHPIALAIIAAAGVPLAAPSANLSTSPSPTTYEHTKQDLWGRADALVQSGDCTVGVESTVVSLLGEVPTVLRPGGVSVEELQQVLPNIVVAESVNRAVSMDETPLSPGMKYRHYAPKAKVVILRGPFEKFKEYLKRCAGPGVWALCFTGEGVRLPCPTIEMGGAGDPDEQARRLFAALRELDEKGAQIAYARCPSLSGMGLAVYNRLVKAAGYEVIELC